MTPRDAKQMATTRPPAPAKAALRAFLALVGWRAVWILLPAVFALLAFAPFSEGAYYSNFHGAEGAPPTFATRWATWDAQHYLHIARHGYVAGHVSSAFWPLWPWLIRGAAKLTTASELPAAIVLANLLALAAAVGLWHLVRARAERIVAGWAVALSLLFPTAFFLGLPYSEALFLALSIGLFIALDRGRPGWAALAALALPLTRPVGLFILLPLVAWLRQSARARRLAAPFSPSQTSPGPAQPWMNLLLLLAPIAGTFAYFVAHLFATGEPLGAFGVRGVFASGQSLRQIVDLPGFLRAFLAIDGLHSITGSWIDRVLFLLAIATLPWLYRRDRVLFWYVVPMALVPALSLRFMAFGRFALVLFPLYWAWAEMLLAARRGMLRWSIASGSLALQLWLYCRHTLNFWAG